MPTSAIAIAAKSVTPRDSRARRAITRVPEIGRNVGPAERIASLGLGGILTVVGGAGRKVNPVALAAGGFLIYRGISGSCPAKQFAENVIHRGRPMPIVIPAKSGVRVELATTIDKPAEELYRAWRDLSQLPRFMSHLVEVREDGPTRSHWVALGPLGMRVEWDAEIIKDEPNQSISWRSLPNADVDTAGSVHFRPAPPGRGTEVRVNLKYDPPAGKAGAMIAKLFGKDARAQIKADLRRFKQLMEAGEVPTTKGQPSCRG